MDDFPDYCLRGMYTENDITQEGIVSATAYFPKGETARDRNDGKCETSIDWEDDSDAFHACMSRYERGVARLSRSALDEINGYPSINGILGYERSPTPENPKHGNILFPADFLDKSKSYRYTIAGAIAARAELVKR